MIEKERSKKYKAQTDDLYRAIGKFTVKFEHVVFSLRQGIIFILSHNGLQNQQLSNILLSDLTAYPMSLLQNSKL